MTRMHIPTKCLYRLLQLFISFDLVFHSTCKKLFIVDMKTYFAFDIQTEYEWYFQNTTDLHFMLNLERYYHQ